MHKKEKCGAVEHGPPPCVYLQREISRSETAKPATTAAPWIRSQKVIVRGDGQGCKGGNGRNSSDGLPSDPRAMYAIERTSFLGDSFPLNGERAVQSCFLNLSACAISVFCSTLYVAHCKLVQTIGTIPSVARRLKGGQDQNRLPERRSEGIRQRYSSGPPQRARRRDQSEPSQSYSGPPQSFLW
jgi:hypothetical protein